MNFLVTFTFRLRTPPNELRKRQHFITKRNLSHCNDLLTDFEALLRVIGDVVDRITAREILGWKCSRETERIDIKLQKVQSKMKVSATLLVECLR